jgi:hypothetical protein
MFARSDVQLVLLIPDSSPEFQRATKPPRLGARIYDRLDRPFRVADVMQSGVDTYTIVCASPTRGIAAMPDLAVDLLDRVRKAISPTERRRRNFLP